MTEKKPGTEAWLLTPSNRQFGYPALLYPTRPEPYEIEKHHAEKVMKVNVLTDQELKDHERRCYYQGREHGEANTEDRILRAEKAAFQAGWDNCYRPRRDLDKCFSFEDYKKNGGGE